MLRIIEIFEGIAGYRKGKAKDCGGYTSKPPDSIAFVFPKPDKKTEQHFAIRFNVKAIRLFVLRS